MKLKNDLQKSSTINTAALYDDAAILPLCLKLNRLVNDKSIFYSDLNNKNISKTNRVNKYYKHITKFY